MTDESRLRLSATVGRSRLDGAWWPRTNDLTRELPYLLAHLPASIGRVMRVVYSKAGWTETPRRVAVPSGRSVRVAPFAGADTHRLLIQMSNGLVVQLMVVPPNSDADSAELLMQTAASAGNHASAAELITTASVALSAT